MRSWLFLVLVACGGGSKASPPPASTPPATGADPAAPMVVAVAETQPQCAEANIKCALDTLSFFSKQMCGCKDKACADKITTDMTHWGVEMSKKNPADVKPSEAEQKQVVETVTRYTDCMTRLMVEGGGTAPPRPTDPCGGDPCGN